MRTRNNPIVWLREFNREFESIPFFQWGYAAIFTRETNFLLECPELDRILREFKWRYNHEDHKEDFKPVFIKANENGSDYVIFHPDFPIHVQCLMPRGFSKTTMVRKLVIEWGLCHHAFNYLLYVCSTADFAESTIREVRDFFNPEINKKAIDIYGRRQPERFEGKKYSTELLSTVEGQYVQAIGSTSSSRGFNQGGFRPDIVVLDDIETNEHRYSEARRAQVRDLVNQSIMPALSVKPRGRIIYLGTIIGAECFFVDISRSPLFATIQIDPIDSQGEYIWAERFNKELLDEIKQHYISQGKLSDFYQEYFNQLHHDEIQPFPPSRVVETPMPKEFRDGMMRNKKMIRSIAIDPAIGGSKEADFCVIAVVGMDEDGVYYVLDVEVMRNAHFSTQKERFIEMCVRNEVTYAGVESVAYQVALHQEILREFEHWRDAPPLEPIKHPVGKKHQRISGVLQPLFESDRIKFVTLDPIVRKQFIDFPFAKDDAPDAITMAISLLPVEPDKELFNQSFRRNDAGLEAFF